MPRMKITIQASDLADMLSVCSMAVSARPLRPINECAYISARQSDGIPLLTMLCKDMGVGIQKVSDRVTVQEDGAALIPAKTLLNFLKLMEGEVTLTVDEKNQATLKGKGKKCNILCMDGAEFEPGFTEIQNPHTCTMNGMDYAALVNGVSHCVSADNNGRMVLTGVYFSFDGAAPQNGAEAVGMDNFRLAITRRGVETNDTFSALVPGTSAKLVEKIIRGAEEVSFRFGSGVMIAEAYDAAIEVSLLSGEYMNYKPFTARNAKLSVKVNTEPLLNALKMAMVSASEGKKGLVSITFLDEDTMQVSALADKSAAVTDIPCMIQGALTNNDGTSAGNQINFNGKYLVEALTVQQQYGEETLLECSSAIAPMIFLPVGREDFFQLVLPVRQM